MVQIPTYPERWIVAISPGISESMEYLRDMLKFIINASTSNEELSKPSVSIFPVVIQ
jgi:hypothetical protein